MYFSFFKPQDWRKRSVVRGRGFIQRFPKYMLHQVKAVTADFMLVNGVPRPDVTGNRQTGGIGVHLKVLLLNGKTLLHCLR